jgi:hypothetical protein
MRHALVLLLLGLGACVRPEPIVTSGVQDRGLERAVRHDGVAIAPVVLVRDLPAPPLPPSLATSAVEAELREGEEHLPTPTVLDPTSPRDAAFLRDEYSGNIRFGGGFIRTGDVALEVRARLIELGLEEETTALGLRWLSEAVPRVLALDHVPVGAPAPALAPVPERRRFRGMHPEDGHDNVNLPRVDLVPTPVDLAALAPDSRATLAAAHWVVVPYLRAYFTHNGGWFLGQTFGCTGGARVEALVVLYDMTTGRPAWWMNVTGRHIQSQVGQPTRAEMDQYLLWSEANAEDQLARGFLR